MTFSRRRKLRTGNGVNLASENEAMAAQVAIAGNRRNQVVFDRSSILASNTERTV